MAKKMVYDSHSSASASGRKGWTFVPMNEDGTQNTNHPTIYCAGATSEAEAKRMMASEGKGAFKQVTETERGVLVSYRYGNLVILEPAEDFMTVTGTRADAAKKTFDQLLKDVKPADKKAALEAMLAGK